MTNKTSAMDSVKLDYEETPVSKKIGKLKVNKPERPVEAKIRKTRKPGILRLYFAYFIEVITA